MERDIMLKFKSMFEDQKNGLLQKQKFTATDFSLPKHGMLDEIDITSAETENAMKLRLRNRETLFIKKVDEALRRISEGSFGQCEDCGDGIEMRRLEARPTTTKCVSCKEAEEHREWVHIDGHKHKSVSLRLRLA